MEQITAKELANRTGAILERIRTGERLRISSRGKVIADLVPVTPADLTQEASTLRQACLQRSRGCLRQAPGRGVKGFLEEKAAEKEREERRWRR